MLIDLLPSLRALNDRCGYNHALHLKRKETFKSKPPLPEVNLLFRPKATEILTQIQTQTNDVSKLKTEFKNQNDSSKQEKLKQQISEVFEKINSGINRLSNLLNLVEKELEDKKREYGDTNCQDRRNIIISNLLAIFRTRFFKTVNKFNQLQADVKATYKEKLERQLRIYQRDLSDGEIKELMSDPEKMNKFVMVHMYGQRKGLENAVNDIDEKMEEIRQLEESMKKLFDMIIALRKIVQQQNQTLDSISATMSNIEDVVMRTHKEMESGKAYYSSAKEVG